MKIISYVILSSFISLTTYFSASDFSFEYQNGQGQGSFSLFKNDAILKENGRFEILKEKSIKIFIDEEEIELTGLPRFASELDHLKVDSLSILSQTAQKFYISLKSGFSKSEDEKIINFESLVINCLNHRHSNNLFFDDFILNCLEKGNIRLGTLVLPKKSFLLQNSIKNAVGKIRLGNIELQADLKMRISGKLKIKAFASYDEEQKILQVKIKSAKLGILPITSILLEELAKIKSDVLKVDKAKKQINIYLKDQIVFQ